MNRQEYTGMRIYLHSQPSRKMMLTITDAYTRSIGKIDDSAGGHPICYVIAKHACERRGYTPKSFLERGEADP